MNLFSRVVHELIICTSVHFPVTRKSGVRDDKVTRRVAISVSDFGVMDGGPIRRRRLRVVNNQPEGGPALV